MTDPCALSDDLLRRERVKWRDRALALKCRLMGNLPGGDFIDLREALSLAVIRTGGGRGGDCAERAGRMSETPDARGFVRCDGCGMRTSPAVKALWGGTCPDCRAGFSTPEHLAEVRASIARAAEYFRSVDEARREARG